MSISIMIQSGDDERFAAEIDGLPAEVAVKRAGGSIVPLFFLLLVPFIFFQFLSSAMPVLVTVFTIVMSAGIIGTIALAYRNAGRPHLMRFDKDGVEVTEQRLIGVRRWHAPYDEFQGVQLRHVTARASAGKAYYEIIELKHRDPRKTLPLYVARTKNEPSERWQAYARLFRRPALEAQE